MRRHALVEGQIVALEEEFLRLYPRLPGAQRLCSLPGLTPLHRALLLAAAGTYAGCGPPVRSANSAAAHPSRVTPGNPPPGARSPGVADTSCETQPSKPRDTSIRACPAFRALYRTLRERLTPTQAVVACAQPSAARDLAHGRQRHGLQPREGRPCPGPLNPHPHGARSTTTTERKPEYELSSPSSLMQQGPLRTP